MHRHEQVRRYGHNEDLDDGTGPDSQWLVPVTFDTAETIQVELRAEYEDHEERTGSPTWMHLVREEVAEAFQEDDPVRLREELLQVAALAVSWIETLDRR